MRNLRIRQWLLLALRTLIILLLVLAFARPSLSSDGDAMLASRSPIEAVIVLDNSLSLNEARLTGTLLDAMRGRFADLEPVFQNGDRITVLQSTIPMTVLARQEPFQPALWERIQSRLEANALKSDLDGAIDAALEQLRQSVYASREIFVLSDFQRSALQGGALGERLALPVNRAIRLYALPLRHLDGDNISVDSVVVVNRLVERNQTLRLKAVLRNHHPDQYLNTLTSVVLNGNRVAQQNVNLPPGQPQEVPFELTLTADGFVEGRVEVESDALLEDNRRFFNFHVPRKIRLLHLHAGPLDGSFLPLITQPARSRGIFDYETEALPAWSSRPFAPYDVIIIEGADQIPANLVLRLETFLQQGGGLFVIPGEGANRGGYQNLFERLELGRFGARRGSPDDPGQFVTLAGFERSHPMFEGLFERADAELNPIEVYAYFQAEWAPDVTGLLRLSDRSHLLAERTVGEGTVFMLTTPLRLDWSELPGKGFVVPLIYRALYFAGTRKKADRLTVAAGQILSRRFSNLEAPFNFRMDGPGGTDIKLTPRLAGSALDLEFRDTEQPGNYRILHNDAPVGILSVNPWPAESRLAAWPDEELAELLPGVAVFDGEGGLAEAVQQSRFGRELWQPLLLAAFLLLLVEMAVARTGRRESAAVTEPS